MNRSRIIFLVCLTAVVSATAVGLVTARQTREHLRRTTDEFSHAREPVRRIAQTARSPQSEIAGPEWLREEADLRREIAALRDELRDVEVASAPSPLQSGSLDRAPRDNNPWPNPTRTDALTTFQAVQWAIHAADLDTLEHALAFDGPAREVAQQFFDALDADSREEFGSPERLVAAAIAAKSRLRHRSAEVAATVAAPDGTVAARVRLSGGNAPVREITLQFLPASDGWRLQVPARVVTSFRDLLIGPRIDPVTFDVVR